MREAWAVSFHRRPSRTYALPVVNADEQQTERNGAWLVKKARERERGREKVPRGPPVRSFLGWRAARRGGSRKGPRSLGPAAGARRAVGPKKGPRRDVEGALATDWRPRTCTRWESRQSGPHLPRPSSPSSAPRDIQIHRVHSSYPYLLDGGRAVEKVTRPISPVRTDTNFHSLLPTFHFVAIFPCPLRYFVLRLNWLRTITSDRNIAYDNSPLSFLELVCRCDVTGLEIIEEQ